jgi:hypothetical protein
LESIEVDLDPHTTRRNESPSSGRDLPGDPNGDTDRCAELTRQQQDEGCVEKPVEIEPASNALLLLCYAGQAVVRKEVIDPLGGSV